MSWTIVNFDDWQVLYNDQGEKELEDHRLDLRSVLQIVGIKCEFKFASEIFNIETVETGVVPDHLGEFPDYAFNQ